MTSIFGQWKVNGDLAAGLVKGTLKVEGCQQRAMSMQSWFALKKGRAIQFLGLLRVF